MTKVLITDDSHSCTIRIALALAGIGIELAEEANDYIAICPTGDEDWPFKEIPALEPQVNRERWRGRGKRRKPRCK